MLMPRIIPCLLIKNKGIVKTVKFTDPKYVGDPINAIKIFNEKEVDELVVLDIMATTEKTLPDFQMVSELAGECFMPLAYGGGIRDISVAGKLFDSGVEKVIINSYARERPDFIKELSERYGAQSIVAAMDVRRDLLGNYILFDHVSRKGTGIDPVSFAQQMQRSGAGEILINSVDRDGMMQGYDLELVRKVSGSVSIPIMACGGSGRLADCAQVIKHGASAAVAGSMFVFQGKHRAVLISYPETVEIKKALSYE
jgi:cyclase